MFKFLSFFRNNKDEQLNDNEYDFNETPTPVIDVEGTVDAQKPALTHDALGTQRIDPAPSRPSPLDTTLADQGRITDIRDELRGISGNNATPLENDDSSSAFLSPEINKESHLEPPNLDLVKEEDVYVEKLGHWNNQDLPSPVDKLVRKYGDQEIQVIGAGHDVLTDEINRIAEDMDTSPADVYFVEVDPTKLDEVLNYKSDPENSDANPAKEVFDKWGESAYIAWLAHSKGKTVRTWDTPFVQQLQDGYQKLGTEGLEPILGSVIGQGLVHVLGRENGQQGDRAEQLIETIRVGVGQEVLDFFEQRGLPVNADTIKRIVTEYSPYDIDSMTEEEVSNFFRPDGNGPDGYGQVNEANRICNESRDEHAIRQLARAKQGGAKKTVIVGGKNHTQLWQKPLEYMYPEEEQNIAA